MSDNTLKMAQIGVGAWGKNLLRNFSSLPQANMVVVCDNRKNITSAVAETYPGLETCEDPARILADPDIQAVVIATETPSHYSLAKAALLAKKHVFVEKPMAQTVAQASELLDISRSNGLKLMVGHILLYHPAFEYVRDLIHSGALGEIYYLYSVRVNLGVVRQNESAFDSLAPHDLSVALDFLGRKAIAVSAQGQAYLQPGVQDVVFATVYFEDGRLAHLHTSWLDPHKVRKVTIVGSKRMAVIDDVAGTEKVRIYDKGVDISAEEHAGVDFATAMNLRTGDISIPKIPVKEPLKSECEHFVQSILNDTAPLSDAQNGLDVVRLLDAARQSMELGGQRIDVTGV
ncbi:MAG: Gfo/Idh/MocA family oxidoreductase [Bacteroidetes bacterium]|nr:MAG: Gfo/Idh/MocA family oxidoreductase [Bacteroidota bacterium]